MGKIQVVKLIWKERDLMELTKNVLTIAGSDSSGGAGIQADLKAFSANGVYGMSVVTSVTAQNSLGVVKVENVSADMVRSQIDSLFSDIRIDAIKIGMIPNREVAEQIAESLNFWKAGFKSNDSGEIMSFPEIVLDPVMISSSGKPLMSEEARKIVVEEIFPLCSLITPNIPEAESLTGIKINSEESLRRAAEKLIEMGPEYVLIKGGHLEGKYSIDTIYDGSKFSELKTERVEGVSPHGTGCTLSSAIAANLAKGMTMEDSIKKAKEYITYCIESSFKIGEGDYFLNHFTNFCQ